LPRAVVVGSGPNGLVGAIVLAQAGLDVTVVEADAHVGGGLRSDELTLPGYFHDVCASVHPLGRSSPALRSLGLRVDWVDPPAAAAHPLADGRAVTLRWSIEETAGQLGRDGDRYRALVRPLAEQWDAIEPALLGPFPLGAGAALAALRALRATGVRALLADARSLAAGFEEERTKALFAGLCAHSILPLERRPSGGIGLLLAVAGHVDGWPSPRGGSQQLAYELVARLVQLGAVIRTGESAETLPEADIVLCDVMPRELVRIARGRLPERYERALVRYRHGPGVCKVDWALSEPIPWRAPGCAEASTVHVGGDFDAIARSEWDASLGRPPRDPFVLVTQPGRFDATRAPVGRTTAWGYCHVPNGFAGDVTELIEAQVERFAPGFRDTVLARATTTAPALETRNRNLVGGDVAGGAMTLGQLLGRPVRSLAPYRTPLEGVYLCSSATPPGGGIHGMCGYSAARLALRDLAR
jgi:phytoene dehydrogenase-like protein